MYYADELQHSLAELGRYLKELIGLAVVLFIGFFALFGGKKK